MPPGVRRGHSVSRGALVDPVLALRGAPDLVCFVPGWEGTHHHAKNRGAGGAGGYNVRLHAVDLYQGRDLLGLFFAEQGGERNDESGGGRPGRIGRSRWWRRRRSVSSERRR